MYKYLITLIVLAVMAVGFVTVLILNAQIVDNDVKHFNAQFEIFNKKSLAGSDVSSAINKVMNNNKKYDDEVNGKQYMIDVNVRIIDFDEDTTINMERIYTLGIDKFVQYYGHYEFECTGLKYDENTGRIKELNFTNK